MNPIAMDWAALFGLEGRLSSVAAGTTTVSYNQFDAMGRVTKHTQTTDAVSYLFTYGYNLAGLNTSTTYPSGRQVKTAYDAAGRANGVQSVMTGHVADVVKSVSYHPHGAALDLGLANGVTVSRTYNAWLQPVRIQAGSLMMLDYGYWVNGNNGNLQSHTVTRGVLIDTQTFQYDTKNRLSNASGTGWGENFLTDDYGNRAMAGAYPSWLATAFTPTSLSNFGGTNNRVYLNGAVYDNVGNQTTIGGYVSTYDGENRLRTSTLNSNTTTFSYDGDGRRVKKVAPPATTVYVYSVSGELAAEYGTNANPVSGMRYLTPDMLGSVRLVSNAIGGVVSCHDYFPYGEEIVATAAGTRTGCYAAVDGVAERFTGQKRDSETNLDYFGARYFSGAQGRFTSADPVSLTAGRLSDPQSLNLYAYSRNNPFRFVDPTGMDPVPVPCEDPGGVSRTLCKPIIGPVRS